MKKDLKKWITLLILCLGVGLMYKLPYIRDAYYIPLREALGLTNTQLGNLAGINGIVSLFLYLPGGVIADRFSYRKLITFSLVSTGILGLYYSTFPSYTMCLMIHVGFAITTIFTYWPTLVKATRLLGDSSEQGRLFGFLEGGKGIAGTIGAFGSLWFFTKLGEKATGLRGAIIFYSVALIIIGVISWFLIEEKKSEEEKNMHESILKGMMVVLKMPKVWLAGMIVFTTYSIYVGMGNLTPYVTDVFKMSVSVGAVLGIIRSYGIQILGGPLGGILSDKIGSQTKYLFIASFVVIIFTVVFMFIPGKASLLGLMIANMLVLSLVVFTMRGIYFATQDEIQVPAHLAGVAAGAISLIGFIPDIFMWTYFGWLLDKFPGSTGYNYTFLSIIGLAVIGLIVSGTLLKLIKKSKQDEGEKATA